MAQTTALMHTGLPAAVARQLGSTDPSFQIQAVGTNQATAPVIPGSYGFLFPVTSGGGAKLPASSGAAQTVLFNADGANAANVFPLEGEIINSWTANTPIVLPAGKALIATPGPKGWIVLLSA